MDLSYIFVISCSSLKILKGKIKEVQKNPNITRKNEVSQFTPFCHCSLGLPCLLLLRFTADVDLPDFRLDYLIF